MITSRTELLKALGVSRSNIGLGIALGVSVQENLMLSAMGVLGSGGAPVPPAQLRYITPQNRVPVLGPTTASGTSLTVRFRVPFYIGSGDVSSLVLSFNGWYTDGICNNYANAYTASAFAFEVDGVSEFVPVTFSGSRSKVINPGDVDIKTDSLSASAFGGASIARGTKMWLRGEYSVTTAGMKLPQGILAWNEYGYPASVGLVIDPAVFNGGVVDGYGNLTIGDAGGWGLYSPYTPIILGTFASGDPATFLLAGDSLIQGYGDTLTGYGLKGGAMQALADVDHVSNPIGGLNCGLTGAIATMWSGAGNAPIREYIQYAKYAVEEFGTNEFNSYPGTDPAVVLARSSAIWDYMIAGGITKIIRTHLSPRTAADGVTLHNNNYASGGNARLFDALLTAGVSFPAEVVVIDNNALRLSATPDTDDYYKWAGTTTNTGDGTHPNTAGCVLEATDYRTAYAA